MKWTIYRDYTFCAAHRLEGHPKCGRLHGHNYSVRVELIAGQLGGESWIMDYAQLDSIVKPIIDELDHRYIVSQENVAMQCPYVAAGRHEDMVLLGVPRSTAEVLAMWLTEQVVQALQMLDARENMVRVTVQETPKSGATYSDYA